MLSELDAVTMERAIKAQDKPAPAPVATKTPGLIVVGVTGHNRAGKDTFASALCAAGGFLRVGLADGIREAFGGLDGPTWEFRKDLDAVGTGSRWGMMTLGTECREDIAVSAHWVNHLLVKLRYAHFYHPEERSRFVVPDVRFPHEVERLRHYVTAWGGRFILVKIVRPGTGVTTGHASETGIDGLKADRVFYNAGTRAELVGNALAFAAEIDTDGR